MTLPTVFIVDDDHAVRDSLAMLLELKGFHTRTYASAEELLERVRPEWPGCLVLDLRMTGMSGLELQPELLRRGFTLPIIIVTAHGDDIAAQAAQDQNPVIQRGGRRLRGGLRERAPRQRHHGREPQCGLEHRAPVCDLLRHEA